MVLPAPAVCFPLHMASQKQPFKTKANPDSSAPQNSPVISCLTWSQGGNSYQRLQSSCVIWPPSTSPVPGHSTPAQNLLTFLHPGTAQDPGGAFVRLTASWGVLSQCIHGRTLFTSFSLFSKLILSEIFPGLLIKYCLHPHTPIHPYPATRCRTWWKTFQLSCLWRGTYEECSL